MMDVITAVDNILIDTRDWIDAERPPAWRASYGNGPALRCLSAKEEYRCSPETRFA